MAPRSSLGTASRTIKSIKASFITEERGARVPACLCPLAPSHLIPLLHFLLLLPYLPLFNVFLPSPARRGVRGAVPHGTVPASRAVCPCQGPSSTGVGWGAPRLGLDWVGLGWLRLPPSSPRMLAGPKGAVTVTVPTQPTAKMRPKSSMPPARERDLPAKAASFPPGIVLSSGSPLALVSKPGPLCRHTVLHPGLVVAPFVGDKPLGGAGSEDTVPGPGIAQSPKLRHGEGDQGRCCAPALCSCRSPASAALGDGDWAGGTPARTPAWSPQVKPGVGGHTQSPPRPFSGRDVSPCPCHRATRCRAVPWSPSGCRGALVALGAEGGPRRVSSTLRPIWIILYFLCIIFYSSPGSLLPIPLHQTCRKARVGAAVRCGSSPSLAPSRPHVLPKSPLPFPLENSPFCSAFEGISPS